MIVSLVVAMIGTVVVHEVGHAAAASLLRLPWRPTLTWHGPGIRIGSDALRLSRFQVAVTAAAGPVANLALAAIAIRSGLGLLALANIEFAVVNLLPLPRSDGRRLLFGQESR